MTFWKNESDIKTGRPCGVSAHGPAGRPEPPDPMPVPSFRPAPERLNAGSLTGLRIDVGDLPDLLGLMTDPRVVPTLTASGLPLSEPEVAARLEAHLWHWNEHGFGAWVFRDPAVAFVGRAALERRRLDEADVVELMYAVHGDRWGRGHGTRMAEALIDVAFGPLGLDELVAFVLPANARSRSILDRCGFVGERRVVHAGLPHDLLRLARPGRGAPGRRTP